MMVEVVMVNCPDSALRAHEDMEAGFAVQAEAAEEYIDELMVELKPLVDCYSWLFSLNKQGLARDVVILSDDSKSYMLENLLAAYVQLLTDDTHCIISDDTADKIKLLNDSEQYGTDAMELLNERLEKEIAQWD